MTGGADVFTELRKARSELQAERALNAALLKRLVTFEDLSSLFPSSEAQELLGCRIEVYWTKEKAWFPGSFACVYATATATQALSRLLQGWSRATTRRRTSTASDMMTAIQYAMFYPKENGGWPDRMRPRSAPQTCSNTWWTICLWFSRNSSHTRMSRRGQQLKEVLKRHVKSHSAGSSQPS